MRRTKVIALSRCLNKRKGPKGKSSYRFHFRGVFLGHLVHEINVFVGSKDKVFLKGKDYLLYLEVQEVKDKSLETQLLRYKNIDHI